MVVGSVIVALGVAVTVSEEIGASVIVSQIRSEGVPLECIALAETKYFPVAVPADTRPAVPTDAEGVAAVKGEMDQVMNDVTSCVMVLEGAEARSYRIARAAN